MARRLLLTVGLVIAGFSAATSPASALTLGNTTEPMGSTPGGCTAGAFYVQTGPDPNYAYSVPTGGGTITSWSTNTAGDAAGMAASLLVMRPAGGSTYTLVGFDNETLPSSLPAVATFALAQPITAAAGDLIGMYSPASSWTCAFTGSPIPASDVISGGLTSGAPTTGAQYTVTIPDPNDLMNLSVNLVQTQDIAIAGGAAPASIPAGGGAEYGFVVRNGGPGSGPITFTDAVPAGLRIIGAAASSGTCTTTGQTVTCTITGLAAGAATPVLIIVSAPSPGVYPDSAAVTATLADPTPADNSASTTLTVTAVPATPACRVVSLTGAPVAVAKSVILALKCKVGRITKKASKTVHKGLVISTSPGAGKTLAAGTKVNFVVSSGPPKKK